MAQLGSKDSSRNLHVNCAIIFFLLLRVCIQILDVTFLAKIFLELNSALGIGARTPKPQCSWS